MQAMDHEPPPSPVHALERLREGNRRFHTDASPRPGHSAEQRRHLTSGQSPFAVVVGCSDSRTSPEIVFDCALGDLFVIRTAGHVIGPESLGSIEFGVAELGAPLVVVLGHQSCGAVAAAREAVLHQAQYPGHIHDLVAQVKPSVEADPGGGADPDSVMRTHVRRTCQALAQRSAILTTHIADGSCAVAGLCYRLDEGTVQVLTGPGH